MVLFCRRRNIVGHFDPLRLQLSPFFLQLAKFSFASGSPGRIRILLRGMVPLIPDLRYTSHSFSPYDNSRAMNRSSGCMVEVALPPHSVKPDILYSPGPSIVAITVSCDHALAGLNNT